MTFFKSIAEAWSAFQDQLITESDEDRELSRRVFYYGAVAYYRVMFLGFSVGSPGAQEVKMERFKIVHAELLAFILKEDGMSPAMLALMTAPVGGSA